MVFTGVAVSCQREKIWSDAEEKICCFSNVYSSIWWQSHTDVYGNGSAKCLKSMKGGIGSLKRLEIRNIFLKGELKQKINMLGKAQCVLWIEYGIREAGCYVSVFRFWSQAVSNDTWWSFCVHHVVGMRGKRKKMPPSSAPQFLVEHLQGRTIKAVAWLWKVHYVFRVHCDDYSEISHALKNKKRHKKYSFVSWSASILTVETS